MYETISADRRIAALARVLAIDKNLALHEEKINVENEKKVKFLAYSTANKPC